MSQDLKKTSKFLSFILRHQPDDIGLTLDSQGWASITELIEKAKPKASLTKDLIKEVVASSDKQRFALSSDGLYIRANQGHSIKVDLGLTPQKPPPVLYHGTASRFVDSIKQEGLKAGQRHHVHLSVDVATATAVGQRYGSPVILKVDAGNMFKQGYTFFLSDNSVWLTKHVPVQYLSTLT